MARPKKVIETEKVDVKITTEKKVKEYVFEVIDKGVSNYKSSVIIDDIAYVIECKNGLIKTGSEKLAQFLKNQFDLKLK